MIERFREHESLERQPNALATRLESMKREARMFFYALCTFARFMSPETAGADEPAASESVKNGSEELFQSWIDEQEQRFDPRESHDMRKMLRMLDAEMYADRREGARLLLSEYASVAEMMNPVPSECFDSVGKGKEQLSVEQLGLLGDIQRFVEERSREKHEYLPPMRYDWNECRELIERQTGFVVIVPSEIMVRMQNHLVKVEIEGNSCYEVLGQLCREAGASLTLGSDHLSLIMADDPKWRGRILWNEQGYIGLEEGGTMRIAVSPRRDKAVCEVKGAEHDALQGQQRTVLGREVPISFATNKGLAYTELIENFCVSTPGKHPGLRVRVSEWNSRQSEDIAIEDCAAWGLAVKVEKEEGKHTVRCRLVTLTDAIREQWMKMIEEERTDFLRRVSGGCRQELLDSEGQPLQLVDEGLEFRCDCSIWWRATVVEEPRALRFTMFDPIADEKEIEFRVERR